VILEIRGVAYHVAVHGSPGREPTVALLHGFSGSTEDWAGAMTSLRAGGYASLAIDLLGHGRTGVAPPARSTQAEQARDLDAIAALLSVPRCHWLGYSMGGRVALRLALAYPERVSSLVLESASPGIADPEARAARRAADERLAADIEARGVEWFAAHWAALPIFETQRSLAPEVRVALAARRARNDPKGLAASLRGMGQGVDEPVGSSLSRIAAPVLLLAGARDAKYVEIARAMEATLPRARTRIIPRAGHTIHLEEPEAFERALIDHLSAVEARDAATVRS
jgi:2-succinyl-6-hydroxy-2,4-cyclohexadiene-1-carboxylate synthase